MRVAIASFLAAAFASSVFPRVATAEVIEIYVTEVPYTDPGPMFLMIGGEYGTVPIRVDSSKATGTNSTFGMTLMSAGPSDFQFHFGFAFGQQEIEALGIPNVDSRIMYFEFPLGARYLSRAPTLMFRRSLAVRFTAGLSAALSESGFPVTAAAGLILSRKDDPSGLLLEVAYHPMSRGFEVSRKTEIGDPAGTDYTPTIETGPYTGFRLSFLWGP